MWASAKRGITQSNINSQKLSRAECQLRGTVARESGRTPMSIDLEDKFERLVAERLAEATRLTGHQFRDLHDLIAQKRAVGAARILLSPASVGTFTYGFRLLAAANLLHLSIEQAAMEFEHSGLFTEEQLSNARARLILARMLAETAQRNRAPWDGQ